MLFTLQVFHLQCLFFFRLLLILEIVSLIKVLLIKIARNIVISLLNMKKFFFHISLFLCLSSISLGRYCQKNVVKSEGGLEKRYKRGRPYRGFCLWMGDSNLQHTMSCIVFHIKVSPTFTTNYYYLPTAINGNHSCHIKFHRVLFKTLNK